MNYTIIITVCIVSFLIGAIREVRKIRKRRLLNTKISSQFKYAYGDPERQKHLNYGPDENS